MKDQIDLLEKTILDLGTEVYRLKHALVSMTLRQQAINKLIDGLRNMLDEKGLITNEEVEEAALTKDLLDTRTAHTDFDTEQERLYTKKGTGH
jgi:hypothetical protein